MSYLKKALIVLAILPIAGCGLSDIMAITCAVSSEPDHCWQAVAIQDANPDECAKVTGKDFVGQNPPRDKCYLLIADETNDYGPCKDIQGGFTSYTPNECVTNIVIKNGDPDGCKNLDGLPAQQACLEAFKTSITADKLTEINDEVDKAKSEAGANPDDKDAKDKLDKLLAKQAAMFENAPEATKSTFMKNSRETILKDVDDADVKAEIVKQTLALRDQNPGMSLNDQLAKLKEVKEQQETVKRLDDEANTLMDQVKSTASDYATTAISDAAEAKARQLLSDHGSDSLKDGIAQIEGLKEKYDKASEPFKKLEEQFQGLRKQAENSRTRSDNGHPAKSR